ncbi:MAG: sugar-binding domain-containing protein [Pseudomonadota bacterium]
MATPDAPLRLDEPGDWPEQLAVRIAWCYYTLGLTQQEIAERLGLTRVRVNRLLAEARRRGVVKITITSPLAENVALEERLTARYGLKEAHVVLAEGEDGATAQLLGTVAAEAVAPALVDGVTVGVGWGITLRAFADQMVQKSLQGAAVVAMLGSLTRRSSIDTFEAATALAHRLHAECFYMPGPLICDSQQSREAIEAMPLLQDIHHRLTRADLAVVSVGGMDSGTIRAAGLISARELDEVRAAGAIGNFLGYYIDANANIIDHPVSSRVLGMRPERLADLPRRLMVSGGAIKVPVLRALLTSGLLTGLVTDQATALSLLEEP